MDLYGEAIRFLDITVVLRICCIKQISIFQIWFSGRKSFWPYKVRILSPESQKLRCANKRWWRFYRKWWSVTYKIMDFIFWTQLADKVVLYWDLTSILCYWHHYCSWPHEKRLNFCIACKLSLNYCGGFHFDHFYIFIFF